MTPARLRNSLGVHHMSAHLRKFGLLTALAALLTAGTARADVVTKPGQLVVEDNGKLFSPAGINKAKDEFARLQSKTGRQVMVETLAELPPPEQAKLSKIDSKDAAAVRRFWLDFTKAEAKTDRAKGIYILICRHPGWVEVIADQEVRNKGFDDAKERQLADDLKKALQNSKSEKTDADRTAAHDKALLSAVDYLERALPGESADFKAPTKPATNHEPERHAGGGGGGGWGIGGIIC